MTAQTRPALLANPFLRSLAPHWIALALFILTLALRIPFQSQTLNDWDSVNHALALTSFNVVAHRPQPPGYILYIGAGRLINFVFPDEQTALVVVSMLASALAVASLFWLGTHLASREIGLIAALLLLTCPAFWFDSEVALPYVVEGAASVVLAMLLYRLLQGEQRLTMLTAVVFAISVGLRQQLALFFAPLVIYAYWKYSWRIRLEALAWFAFVCALWFFPLAWSAGGIGGYLQALRNLNNAFSAEYGLLGSGGEEGILRNGLRMGAYTAYAMNFAAIPLLIGGIQIGLARWKQSGIRFLWTDKRIPFFVLWVAPSMGFYLFFHMGSPGLIYVFLTALFLLTPFALYHILRANPRGLGAAVALLCAANLFIFFGTPPDLYTGRALRVLNYSSLVAHDRYLESRVQAIDSQYDPQTTLILSTDWRFAEYYLPNYRIMLFLPHDRVPLLVVQNKQENYVQLNDGRASVNNVKTIVLFDSNAGMFYHGATGPQCAASAVEPCLQVIPTADAALSLRADGVYETAP
jgi:Dolichyl-phosphate-mannose-protein mannosyltransferase